MKKKTILYLVSLFFLSVPLTGRGQDKKAWEIGAGGSLINWSRVSVTGFQSTPDNYMYNLKANHLMGGANLYVARELNRWFYLDLQGTVGVAKTRTGLRAMTGNTTCCIWAVWACSSALPPCLSPNGWNPTSEWG